VGGIPADPGGGSFYIEALTASIAAEAWKVYEDGLAGRDAAIAAARAAKEKAVAQRKRTLVGEGFPSFRRNRIGRRPDPKQVDHHHFAVMIPAREFKYSATPSQGARPDECTIIQNRRWTRFFKPLRGKLRVAL